jgi:hypothetical protein
MELLFSDIELTEVNKVQLLAVVSIALVGAGFISVPVAVAAAFLSIALALLSIVW